ncbi:MAG: thioredoxin [Patescibacteria group bacterium]|nr:thioredoxin [Patescibacteria group bacterium]
MTQHFNEKNFNEEVIKASNSKPVLVDFFASWCGPCQAQSPTIDELAESFKEKAVIGKLDVGEFKQIAADYGVMSIPAIMIFKNEKVVENFVGLQTKEILENAVNKYL